ncbi:MAG: IS66 family transposase [Candidatus Nealsonbacteria bacterium]|nr:IS66 family transposase [Candidatus Nealsonbacteria bacterium]
MDMSRVELSKTEIKKRLIRLRNIEFLYEKQRLKIRHLRDENRELRQEIKRLNVIVADQQKTIDDMKLQIEELRVMVFGKKKKSKEIDDNDLTPPTEKVERTSDSFKRPIPTEVTEIKNHPLNQCACGAKTSKKKTVIFYEEDIPIPAKKIVLKHIVEKAYCTNCKKWSTGIPLPSAKVILGPNVQKYTCYLSTICRLSFSQIQEILQDTYQIHISEGEIAKILNREAVKLRPFYEQLKVKIRGEPVIHLDETSWKIFMGDGYTPYSWVMSGSISKENVFLVGKSRGKGNTEHLIGEDFNGVVVSDDYGVYRKLNKHQLCWAHLIRKFRDLAKSGELDEKTRLHCKNEYQKLCLIYEDLKQNRKIEKYAGFSERLTKLSRLRKLDPQKLIRVKTTLVKNIPKYLTCLSDSRIPLTNNQAERSLRHLILKRKISFGSLTKRTADNLAILLSVLMSLRQRFQSNFFLEYLRV